MKRLFLWPGFSLAMLLSGAFLPVQASEASSNEPPFSTSQVATLPIYATDASLLLGDGQLAQGLDEGEAESIASDLDSSAEASPRPALDQLGRNQRWSVSAEYFPLKRSIGDINLNTSVDIVTAENFGTDDLDFDLESGTRLSVGYHFTPENSLELRYFGLQDWESTATFTSSVTPGGDDENLFATFIDDPFLGDDGEPEDFAQARSQAIEYRSDLDNLELSYRWQLDPPEDQDPWQGSLVAGLRFMRLDEGFSLASFDGASRRGGDEDVGFYDIDTENRMVGLQVGGDLNYQVSRNFGLTAQARGGLMLNFANQDSVLTNQGDTLETFRGDGHGTLISPVIELGLFANWDISPNVSLNAGINYMYLSNVALAPEQFASQSPATGGSLGGLNTGDASYWGPSVGLNARF